MKTIVKTQSKVYWALLFGVLLFCLIGAVVRYDSNAIRVIGWFGVMVGAVVGGANAPK